jgi:hypothetical protein|tara:strand:- start:144 stop:332 length:189 start_codon:yes stop_codon:yes gene_type:complete
MEKFHEIERRLYKKHSGGGFNWNKYWSDLKSRSSNQESLEEEDRRVKEIDDRADREGWFHGS